MVLDSVGKTRHLMIILILDTKPPPPNPPTPPTIHQPNQPPQRILFLLRKPLNTELYKSRILKLTKCLPTRVEEVGR